MKNVFWAVVQTEAQRELAVCTWLKRRGVCEVYSPRIKNPRVAPLFPGYVFACISDQWYSVLWTPHVVRLLMSGDRPARLADNVIEELRRREVGGFVRLPKLPGFKRGQPVRIVRGSFEGRIGVYQGMNGRDRERVLLELLGQSVAVNVPIGTLSLVESQTIR